jgi:transposase
MERAEAEAILDGDREMAVALLMRAAELIEANRRLESRVADLEQRLSRDSHNSSLPPSADPPSAPPRPRQAASGRQPGAEARPRGQLSPAACA